MKLGAPDWVNLNRLLDQALDLDPSRRAQWMESLPEEYASLRDTLRNLLLSQGGVETMDVFCNAPFARSQVAPSQPGDLIGPYRLLREIGAGGMASVWLAERADGTLQRQVALKLPRMSFMERDLAERLARERDILASLEHPNIARLYDAGVDSADRPFLALEYVDGVALDIYVAQRQLSLPDRLTLFEQVATAVGFAHARLIVHHDLKPSNILVRDDGEVRLLDFGIARLLQPELPANAAHSNPMLRAFTPRFAAPEQFSGEPPTVAADIYSLGVVLYELLSGVSPYPKRPLRTSEQYDVVCLETRPITQVVNRESARALRGDLAAILDKALRHDARERYECVSDFLEDIRRYRQHLPVTAHPDSVLYRARHFMRRHRTAVAFGAVLSCAVIAGVTMSLWQADIALRERDRAVRLLTQSQATNEFWNMMLGEGVGNDESINMTELMARSERMAQETYRHAPMQYAVAIDVISGLYISYGFSSKAQVLLEAALERLKNTDVGNRRIDSLRCKYALAISNQGRWQDARQILETVIARSADEPDLQQYCLHRFSIVARDNNDADKALQYAQEAWQLSLASPAQTESNTAQLLGDLGYAYAINGQSDLAERYYQQSWALYEKLGRTESDIAVTVLNNWAVLAISAGQPAVALRRLEQAIAIAEKRSPTGEPAQYMLANHSRALMMLGRYDAALHCLLSLRTRAVREGNVRQLAYGYANTMEIHARRGELQLAQQTLDEFHADKSADLTGRGPAVQRMLGAQAELLKRRGELEAALRLYDTAIAEFDRGRTVVGGQALAFVARAEALLASRRYDDATRDAARALQIATQTRGSNRFSSVLGLASLIEGEILAARGQRPAAAKSLRVAVDNLTETVGADHPDTTRAALLLRQQT